MIAARVQVPCLWVVLALVGCVKPLEFTSVAEDESSAGTGTATEPTGGAAKYHATIRRTAYGVAHILADDLGSAGFGQAYAFAQDHACVLADQILKVRSERSLFLGPGAFGEHLDSDFGYLSLEVMKRAEAGLAAQTAEVRALIDGYVAGYNQFLADTGTDAVVGSCGGQAWLRPISALDLFAYYVDLGLLGSGNALLDYLATAQPPGSPLVRPGGSVEGLRGGKATGIGSNGWAIRKARSASGAGMVVANPHFPWEGELKLWESQVTVPGVMNVYGVGLMGVPGALIGFNEHVGWTHTFSDGQRFNIYKLDLVDGDPTSYLYDGKPRKMTSETYTLQVRQEDGTTQEASRTLYKSHYGPILNVDPFGWSSSVALTYRDANIENTRLIEQFFGMNLATSLADFKKVYEEVNGIPWVNTMAADVAGDTWYIDASATPRLDPKAIAGWLQAVEDGDFLTGVLYEQGLVLLDGGDPLNEWTDAPGARSPGIVPYSEFPQLDREDFVFNANDSHWLSNPAAPLEDYSPLHGFERVPQSPRTRMNIHLLADTGADSAAGADGKFTVSELQAAIMGNRSMTAELLLDAVVERCDGVGKVTVVDVEVDISEACATLAGWDGRFNADSVGAVVWREFLGSFNFASAKDYGPLFAVPFDADDPAATPNTLTPAVMGEPDKVLEGLGKAVQRLAEAGVAVDAALGAVQVATRGEERFGLAGGQSRDGTANQLSYGSLKTTLDPLTPRGEVVSDATGLTKDGEYVVNYGSSFVMAVELGPKGPQGSAFLTYSESDDPASPHFSDQTALFSAQTWRPIVFAEADIAADPSLQTLEVAGGE